MLSHFRKYLRWRIAQLDGDEDGEGIQYQLIRLVESLVPVYMVSTQELISKCELALRANIAIEVQKDIATFKEIFREELHKRLLDERRNFRRDHPFGFTARPVKKADGTDDLWCWKCSILGKQNTAWEDGQYHLTLLFTDRFPAVPPRVIFHESYFHPNIASTGEMAVAYLEKRWKPSTSVKTILLCVQHQLSFPSLTDPQQFEAFIMYRDNITEYNQRVLIQAEKYKNPDLM